MEDYKYRLDLEIDPIAQGKLVPIFELNDLPDRYLLGRCFDETGKELPMLNGDLAISVRLPEREKASLYFAEWQPMEPDYEGLVGAMTYFNPDKPQT